MGYQSAICIFDDDIDVAQDRADLLGALVVNRVREDSIGITSARDRLHIEGPQVELVEDVGDT
jgi:hypothetical protein